MKKAIIISIKTALIDILASFLLKPIQKTKNIMRYEYLSTTHRLHNLKPNPYSRVMDIKNGTISIMAVVILRYLSQSSLIILQIKSP